MSVDLRAVGDVLINFQHIIQRLNGHSSGSESLDLENLIKEFVLERTAFEEMVIRLLSSGFNSAEVKNFLDKPPGDIWTNDYIRKWAPEQVEGERQEYFSLLGVVGRILAEFREELDLLNSSNSTRPVHTDLSIPSMPRLERLWTGKNKMLLEHLRDRLRNLYSRVRASRSGRVSRAHEFSRREVENVQREEQELGIRNLIGNEAPSFDACRGDSTKCRAGSLVLYESKQDLRLRWLLAHVNISGNNTTIRCCWTHCGTRLTSVDGFLLHALNCEAFASGEYKCLDQLERAWYDNRPGWQRARSGVIHAVDAIAGSSRAIEIGRWGQGQHIMFEDGKDIPLSPQNPEDDQVSTVIVDRVSYNGVVLARKSMVFEVLQDVNHLEKEMEHLTRLKHFHILQAFGSYLEFNNDRYAILLYPYCEYTLTRFMRECEIIAPGPTDPRELVSLNSDRMLMRLYLESFFPCLAQALRFIYSQTTRHMDIKPSNILVKKRPRGVREGRLFHLFIADFDISSTFTSFAKTGTKGLTRKTDKYCAPEVVPPSMPEGVPSKAEWGSRADVFSLGCVFAEMLTTIACRRLLDFDKYRRKDNRSSNFYETIPQALKWLTDLSVFKDDYKALGDQARLYWYRRGKYEAFELWHETFTTTVEITKEMLQKDQKLRPRVSELCPRLKTGDCCCGETLPVVEESFD